MTPSGKIDKALDPVHVRFFRARAVVTPLDRITQLL
jgi:hypothetical protein